MIEKNNTLFLVVIVVQLMVGIALLFFGSTSIYRVMDVRNENKQHQKYNVEITQDIVQLRNKIELLNLSFIKEKFAREQLHMARKSDIVYNLS